MDTVDSHQDSDLHSESHDQGKPKVPGTVIFKHDSGLTFAAGMDWTEASNLNEAKLQVNKGVAFVYGKSTTTGQLSVGIGRREAAKAHSLGMLIGRQYPEALIFAQLPKGEYWVCMISGGLPTAGFDLVFDDESSAKAMHSEASSYLSASSVAMISSRPGAKASLDEAIESSVKAWQDSWSGKKGAAFKEFQLQAHTFNWLRFALILVALLIVTGLAVGGLLYREQLLDQRKREGLLQQALKSEQELEAIRVKRAAAIASFREKVEAERVRFGRQAIAFAQWQSCEELRRNMPISSHGYLPNKLTCDFDKSEATLEWTPLRPETRLADRAALPGVVDKYSVGNPVVTKLPLIKPLDGGEPAVVLNPAAVQMAILDWAGARMRSMRIDAPMPVVISPPKEAEGAGLSAVTLGSKAALTFQASNTADLLTATSAMRMLNSYAVALQQVVWTKPSTDGISMQATGVLYLPAAQQ